MYVLLRSTYVYLWFSGSPTRTEDILFWWRNERREEWRRLLTWRSRLHRACHRRLRPAALVTVPTTRRIRSPWRTSYATFSRTWINHQAYKPEHPPRHRPACLTTFGHCRRAAHCRIHSDPSVVSTTLPPITTISINPKKTTRAALRARLRLCPSPASAAKSARRPLAASSAMIYFVMNVVTKWRRTANWESTRCYPYTRYHQSVPGLTRWITRRKSCSVRYTAILSDITVNLASSLYVKSARYGCIKIIIIRPLKELLTCVVLVCLGR